MPTRILIADDNPVIRRSLRALLENAGRWEITEAQNGQDAVAKAGEVRPDLIVLDLVMPVMDGLAAAREIARILPGTPILMNTLHWSPQVELEAQKAGVRKVVPKSEGSILKSAVQQLIGLETSGAGAQPLIPDGAPGVPSPASICEASKAPESGGSATLQGDNSGPGNESSNSGH